MKTIGLSGPLSLQMLTSHLNPSACPIPAGAGGSGLPLLIHELLKRDYQCAVFTLDQSITEPVTLCGTRIKIHVSPSRKTHRARDFFAVERKYLLRSMEAEKVDLINAHWTYEYALATLDSGRPCLVTVRDAPFQILRYNFSPYRIMRTLMALNVIKRAQKLVAVSEYIQKHLRRNFGVKSSIPVIPNGLSAKLFAYYRPRPTLSEKKVIFASVANGWGRLKNVKTLLKAFSLVQKQMKQAELWMFGDDYGRHEPAEQWALHNRADQGVRFMGHMDHLGLLDRLSSEVDILVHPSLEESFSNAVIEAMALGIPVIGGRNSGAVPDTLGHGEAGILADVHAAGPLAMSMLELAANVVKRKQLSESGRAYALSHYRIEQVADQYELVYQRILSGASE